MKGHIAESGVQENQAHLIPTAIRSYLRQSQIDLLEGNQTTKAGYFVSVGVNRQPLTHAQIQRISPHTKSRGHFSVVETHETWQDDLATHRNEQQVKNRQHRALSTVTEVANSRSQLKLIVLSDGTSWFDQTEYLDSQAIIPEEPILRDSFAPFWEEYARQLQEHPNDGNSIATHLLHLRIHVDRGGVMRWKTDAEMYASFAVARIVVQRPEALVLHRLRYEGGNDVLYGSRPFNRMREHILNSETFYSMLMPGYRTRPREVDEARVTDPPLL